MLDMNMKIDNPKLLSPLTLAFLGDAVYELCVRQYIVAQGNSPVDKMHLKKVDFVNAAAQSAAIDLILPELTQEEVAVYKRGRNATTSSSPKHASLADYRRATGLEALFGYLYLRGETQRIHTIFAIALRLGEDIEEM